MGAQVNELVEQIRLEAEAHLMRENRGVQQINGVAAAELDRLRANLAIVGRAQDRLPPVTSNRHGRIARFELWIKRGLKRATRWFTWEQTNFNTATVSAIESTIKLLAHLESALSELRYSIHGSQGFAKRDQLIGEIDARLTALESSIQSSLAEIQSQQPEQARRIDSLIEEQRVCFRQLAIEISEVAIVSDRAKRNLEMQIAELTQRLDETTVKKKAAEGL